MPRQGHEALNNIIMIKEEAFQIFQSSTPKSTDHRNNKPLPFKPRND